MRGNLQTALQHRAFHVEGRSLSQRDSSFCIPLPDFSIHAAREQHIVGALGVEAASQRRHDGCDRATVRRAGFVLVLPTRWIEEMSGSFELLSTGLFSEGFGYLRKARHF
mmetsp:Transcript_38627/g.58287  ORF Transcript_38627/g.58287 Transcript_38627/m.58287 type:complete len:110 (+) Transcript_38627:436-765(+)